MMIKPNPTQDPMAARIPVVFVTPTRFGVVNNGPAVYAEYLWEAFSNHSKIEFHLVAPASNVDHPQIHVSGIHRRSKTHYDRLQQKAIEVASSFGDRRPIVHGNTAHTMWRFKDFSIGPVIAQVNDYDAANVFDHPLRTLLDYGPRRLASLIWRHFQERKAISFLDKVVCNSQFTNQQIRRNYPMIDNDKSIVIYKAVDLSQMAYQPNQNSAFTHTITGQPRILFVGCNWQRKGLDIAIKAVTHLVNRWPNLKFVVAGAQNQKADARIRAMPKQLGVENNVQFLGAVDRDDMNSLFQAVDFCVLPSRQEALGVAILESLASGKRVVATRVGGITEILDDCRYSKLVDSGDHAALALACESVLSDIDQEKVAQAECLSTAERFSKKTMITRLEALYGHMDERTPSV